MYTLAAKFANKEGVSFFVARTRKALKPIMLDATAWRLHDGSGWCDASGAAAWQWVDNIYGQSAIIILG